VGAGRGLSDALHTPIKSRRPFATALFGATIFTSAALLFVVQPMFARVVLPLLGGAPAVWNTAMVFYQAALLAGYAYAHGSTAWLGVRKQSLLHVLLLLVPLLVLPIVVPAGWTPPTAGNPLVWLLALLTVAVGLPFFVVSTTSPVLQAWFASTDERGAADPYFLYAASNVGSVLALLSYPLWIEPQVSLATQSAAWRWGYVALVALVAACAVRLWITPRSALIGAGGRHRATAEAAPLGAGQRWRWLALSFVPSSLMLGVTTYLSSEIAAVPLLWVLPLALYLLTFVLAFARRQIFSGPLLARLLPIALVPLVLVLNLQATEPIGGLMLLHLAAFFIVTLQCHRELAAGRPPASQLTEFYLWLSIGGVLGGIFNALVAPLVFDSIAEYSIALVLSAAVVGWRGEPVRLGDFLWAVLLGIAVATLVIAAGRSSLADETAVFGMIFGAATLSCYFLSGRRVRFALALAAVLFAGGFYHAGKGRVLHAERSFFGVHRVTLDPTGKFHLLVHGATLHGKQNLDPAHRREPLTYYHPSGPIGDVMANYARGETVRVGAVGLGAGSLAAFARPGQTWTYFEIDPVVERLARDPRFFTFLRDAAVPIRVVLGDARLSLVPVENGAFDVLVLDAYSSDAIPVHLMTREALALYQRKLAPHGVLAFHISNLHLDLEPVLANLARDAGLVGFVRDDTEISAAESGAGKSPSIWLVMARAPADVAALARDARWTPARGDPRQRVWTDDYSSLLSVFRWR